MSRLLAIALLGQVRMLLQIVLEGVIVQLPIGVIKFLQGLRRLNSLSTGGEGGLGRCPNAGQLALGVEGSFFLLFHLLHQRGGQQLSGQPLVGEGGHGGFHINGAPFDEKGNGGIHRHSIGALCQQKKGEQCDGNSIMLAAAQTARAMPRFFQSLGSIHNHHLGGAVHLFLP
jgi:hypothetical protein